MRFWPRKVDDDVYDFLRLFSFAMTVFVALPVVAFFIVGWFIWGQR